MPADVVRYGQPPNKYLSLLFLGVVCLISTNGEQYASWELPNTYLR